MPLPDAWVDSIFARIAVRYGSAWTRKWEGIDAAAVKADWANSLSGFGRESIAFALDNMPPAYPPTVFQFRDACIEAPEPSQPRLNPPRADPAKVAAILGSVNLGPRPFAKAWAYALQDRDANHGGLLASGRAITPTQRRMYRAVTDRADTSQTSPEDRARTEQLKAETQRKVDAYVQEHA